jgi:hypothetical protein
MKIHALALALTAGARVVHALWPIPSSYSNGTQTLWITGAQDIIFAYEGPQVSPLSLSFSTQSKPIGMPSEGVAVNLEDSVH